MIDASLIWRHKELQLSACLSLPFFVEHSMHFPNHIFIFVCSYMHRPGLHAWFSHAYLHAIVCFSACVCVCTCVSLGDLLNPCGMKGSQVCLDARRSMYCSRLLYPDSAEAVHQN